MLAMPPILTAGWRQALNRLRPAAPGSMVGSGEVISITRGEAGWLVNVPGCCRSLRIYGTKRNHWAGTKASSSTVAKAYMLRQRQNSCPIRQAQDGEELSSLSSAGTVISRLWNKSEIVTLPYNPNRFTPAQPPPMPIRREKLAGAVTTA